MPSLSGISMFSKPEYEKPAFDILRELEVIDDNNKYINARKLTKGIFLLWISILKRSNPKVIIHLDSKSYIEILNGKIDNLNLRKDLSEFSKKYKTLGKQNIKEETELKFSEFSADGKF